VIIVNNWGRAAAYVFLAVVFLGLCLYFAFNYLVSVAPPLLVYTNYPYTFTKSTILSDLLPRFFWTAFGFVVASIGVGFYMGSHIVVKRRWEIVVYIFAPAFLIACFQNIAFGNLIYAVPIDIRLGSIVQEITLTNFFGSTLLLPLFCFFVASIGLGLYIGHTSAEKRKPPTTSSH
jgi:hypothetical protein